MQKTLILLITQWSKGGRGVGPRYGAPLGEPLPVASSLHRDERLILLK